jgi:hypothetical protein
VIVVLSKTLHLSADFAGCDARAVEQTCESFQKMRCRLGMLRRVGRRGGVRCLRQSQLGDELSEQFNEAPQRHAEVQEPALRAGRDVPAGKPGFDAALSIAMGQQVDLPDDQLPPLICAASPAASRPRACCSRRARIRTASTTAHDRGPPIVSRLRQSAHRNGRRHRRRALRKRPNPAQ